MRRTTLLAGLTLLATATASFAADFTVTNINSSGPGSLHQAISDANNSRGADRILFNIPGAGVHRIDVSQNQSPLIEESLVIDGYSQPGAKPNSLAVGSNAVILIHIDGGSRNTSGLVLSRRLAPDGNGYLPSSYHVRGLCLTRFGPPSSRATLAAAIAAAVVDSAVIAGNFIGVLPDGETASGNSIRVGHVTQLGGNDPASRNVISGNNIGFAGEAPPADAPAATGAVVEGNYIGTNASGTKAVPNITGIGLKLIQVGLCANREFDLANTMIGGTAPGAGNLISGNATAIGLGSTQCLEVRINPRPSHAVNGVRIKGNAIGLQSDGTSPLPNSLLK